MMKDNGLKRYLVICVLVLLCGCVSEAVSVKAAGTTLTPIEGTEGAVVNEEFENLFDDDVTTKWCVTDFNEKETVSAVWMMSEPLSLTGFTMTTGNDNSVYEGRNPKTWTLSGRNRADDEWELISAFSGTLADENYKEYTCNLKEKSKEYLYFKLTVVETAGANTMQLSGFMPVYEESVPVSAPDYEKETPSSDSLVVQDMYDYMQEGMTFESITEKKSGEQYRKFKGGSDSYALISRYVEDLCKKSSFELTDSYYFDSKDIFFSFALKYTGSGKVSSNKMEMNFKDNVYGDVTIYGVTEGSSCKGYIYIVDGLEFDDLGLRADGESVAVTSAGESLNSDLIRLNDGSYETSDGRFQVKAGQAMVYCDGTPYTTDAALLRNKDENREELQIYNFYRNDSILLTVPYNSVMTGDVFDQRTIGYSTNIDYDDNMTSMESFTGWKFSSQLLGVCHNGDYMLCYYDDKNDLNDVSVRVMDWDADRQEAVFYIYVSFDTAPYEYEAVAAVNMENVESLTASGAGDDNGLFTPCSACGGSGTCSTCGGSGTVTKWVGDQYMTVRCTAHYCLDGRCSACWGTGHQ